MKKLFLASLALVTASAITQSAAAHSLDYATSDSSLAVRSNIDFRHASPAKHAAQSETNRSDARDNTPAPVLEPVAPRTVNASFADDKALNIREDRITPDPAPEAQSLFLLGGLLGFAAILVIKAKQSATLMSLPDLTESPTPASQTESQ